MVWLVTAILSLIGLSGVADGYVEWREFFETGFMEHYRAAKEAILSWLPFEVWSWVPDYVFLGMLFASVSVRQYDRGLMVVDEPSLQNVKKLRFLYLAVFYIFFLLAWPVAIILTVYQEIFHLIGGIKTVRTAALKEFFLVLVFGLILIFLLADFFATTTS